MTQKYSTVSWQNFVFGKQILKQTFIVPDFVKMLEDEDYVYFFLREQAVEYINCGKVGIISLSYHKLQGKANHIFQNK